ncbi:MAG: GNAT family N-acetyltransferase [Oscillospiraceae bacterium]|nr:GNAT family N-acetyltransferase [Oscillospiraceae bacterium]
MEKRIIDEEITLIPYYPNHEVTFQWYQDLELCRQVDNIDHVYTMETLKSMYFYLSTHGDCYYIEYKGQLVGDVTLKNDGEIAIVICREYQNRHIGRRCIKNIIELAGEKGMSQVKAEIYPFNEQSRNMFLTVGFEHFDNNRYIYNI